MAKSESAASRGGKKKKTWVDPTWPQAEDGSHPVTELAAAVAGGLSPFGDLEFPLDSVPYIHPTTVINRSGAPSPGATG